MGFFSKFFKKEEEEPKGTISLFWGPEDRWKAPSYEVMKYQKNLKASLPPEEEDPYWKILTYNANSGWKAPMVGELTTTYMYVLAKAKLKKKCLVGGFDKHEDKMVSVKEGASNRFAEQLVDWGYLRVDTYEEALSRLKLPDLQNACEEIGIAPEKTKKKCIQKLWASAKKEYIDSLLSNVKLCYHLTEKGEKQLEDYPAVLELNELKISYIDVNQAYMLKELDQSRSLESLMEDFYKSVITRLWANKKYLEIGNYGQSLSMLYILNVRDPELASRALVHAILGYRWGMPPNRAVAELSYMLQRIYDNSDWSPYEIAETMFDESEYFRFPYEINETKFTNLVVQNIKIHDRQVP